MTFPDSLSRFEAAIDALDCPAETRLGLLNYALHLIENGLAVKFNCVPASGARKLVVETQPTERFLGLMAAVGAGESDGLIGGGHD